MKKILFILFAVIFIAFAAIPALAESVNPRLVDGADILTARQETDLLALMNEVSEKNSYDVVIITTQSLGGKTPYQFAKTSFIEGGYGLGENKSGVILIVSMAERDWYIEFFGDKKLPEGTAMSEYFLSDLKKGHYYSAFSNFVNAVDQKQQFPLLRNIAISAVVALVVALIVTGVMKGKLKSVHFRHDARQYVRSGSFVLNHSRDLYLYSTITRVARPKNNGGGGRSGGGGSRGGGGKF